MLSSITWACLGAPLHLVYMKGPHWIGWQGKRNADICAEITSTSALLWEKNIAACEDIIDRNFDSVYVVCKSALYVYLLISFATVMFRSLFLLALSPLSRNHNRATPLLSQ